MLKEMRQKQGVNQESLAARLNVPQSFVSKYEAGERTLDIFELRSICLALGTSLPNFITELEKKIEESEA